MIKATKTAFTAGNVERYANILCQLFLPGGHCSLKPTDDLGQGNESFDLCDWAPRVCCWAPAHKMELRGFTTRHEDRHFT